MNSKDNALYPFSHELMYQYLFQNIQLGAHGILRSVVQTVEEGNGHSRDIATVICHAWGKAQRLKTATQKVAQVRYSRILFNK